MLRIFQEWLGRPKERDADGPPSAYQWRRFANAGVMSSVGVSDVRIFADVALCDPLSVGYSDDRAERGETRRQYILLDAVNPEDGKLCKIQISFDRMQAVARRSLGQGKECGYILPSILQKPTAIFEGLRQDDDADLPIDHAVRFKRRLL